MAENDFNPVTPDLAGADDGQPQLGLLAQYVKDLSFENPNAPGIYQSQAQPQVDVQVSIGTATVADDVHEVSLKLEVRAVSGTDTAFAVELVYAGLFGARNVPEDALRPFLYTEAPRLLFPFARRIVADTIRDGNFAPLLLDPVDFAALYAAQVQGASDLAQVEPAGQA